MSTQQAAPAQVKPQAPAQVFHGIVKQVILLLKFLL
jgi:hypothetical protein